MSSPSVVWPLSRALLLQDSPPRTPSLCPECAICPSWASISAHHAYARHRHLCRHRGGIPASRRGQAGADSRRTGPHLPPVPAGAPGRSHAPRHGARSHVRLLHHRRHDPEHQLERIPRRRGRRRQLQDAPVCRLVRRRRRLGPRGRHHHHPPGQQLGTTTQLLGVPVRRHLLAGLPADRQCHAQWPHVQQLPDAASAVPVLRGIRGRSRPVVGVLGANNGAVGVRYKKRGGEEALPFGSPCSRGRNGLSVAAHKCRGASRICGIKHTFVILLYCATRLCE